MITADEAAKLLHMTFDKKSNNQNSLDVSINNYKIGYIDTLGGPPRYIHDSLGVALDKTTLKILVMKLEELEDGNR